MGKYNDGEVLVYNGDSCEYFTKGKSYKVEIDYREGIEYFVIDNEGAPHYLSEEFISEHFTTADSVRNPSFKFKVGDTLINKNFASVNFTIGESYEVERIYPSDKELTVINDSEAEHHLSEGFIEKNFIHVESEISFGRIIFIRECVNHPELNGLDAEVASDVIDGEFLVTVIIGDSSKVCAIDVLSDVFEPYEGIEQDIYTPEDDEEIYSISDQSLDSEDLEEVVEDFINSPSHYKRGDMETIDIIERMTEGFDNSFVGYNIGNVVKYLDRAPYKHECPKECLEKAAWYLNKAIEKL